MLGARGTGPAGRMQRKAQKNEAADAWERLVTLCLRCHSPAERLSAGDERQPERDVRRCRNSLTHGSLGHPWRIGAALSGLHVWKLVPVGRDAAPREDVGCLREKMVSHPRPGPMREHVQLARIVWPHEQTLVSLPQGAH